jgi:hypothetical protein
MSLYESPEVSSNLYRISMSLYVSQLTQQTQ